jgi:hypothetical protein
MNQHYLFEAPHRSLFDSFGFHPDVGMLSCEPGLWVGFLQSKPFDCVLNLKHPRIPDDVPAFPVRCLGAAR